MCTLSGKKNHIKAVFRKVTHAGSLTQHPLATIPEDGVANPFWRDKRHPAGTCFITLSNTNTHERVTQPFSLRKDLLKVTLRLNSPHHGG